MNSAQVGLSERSSEAQVNEQHYLEDVARRFRKQKQVAERALAQVSDEQFSATLAEYDEAMRRGSERHRDGV